MFEIGVRIREKRVEPGFPAMVDCEGLEGLVMMGDGRADIHFFIQTVKDGTYGLLHCASMRTILSSDRGNRTLTTEEGIRDVDSRRGSRSKALPVSLR